VNLMAIWRNAGDSGSSAYANDDDREIGQEIGQLTRGR
jgi:hypothetical protein